MKRVLKKAKNIVLWVLFYFNLVSLILSVSCMDSDYYIIFGIVAVLNMAYMALFYVANYNRFERWLNKA